MRSKPTYRERLEIVHELSETGLDTRQVVFHIVQ